MQQTASTSRSTWVAVLVVLQLIAGAFGILVGLRLITADRSLLSSLTGALVRPFSLISAGTPLDYGFLFLVLLFLTIYIIAGIGLWRRLRWARPVSLVLLWLACITSLLTSVLSLLGGSPDQPSQRFGQALLFTGVEGITSVLSLSMSFLLFPRAWVLIPLVGSSVSALFLWKMYSPGVRACFGVRKAGVTFTEASEQSTSSLPPATP